MVALSLFAPERPKLNNLPMLLRPDGSNTNSVVPALTIEPQEDGTLCVWAFFHVEGSTCARFDTKVDNFVGLELLFRSWIECPERCAKAYFDWTPRDHAAPRSYTVEFDQERLRKLSIDEIEFE